MDVAIRSVSAQPQSQFQSQQRVWKRNNTTSQRKNPNKICKYWIKGSCKFGDQACKFQHRWFTSDDGLFSELAQLKGHTNAINGIGLPSGSDKLCSSSSEAVRIWDCNTGQCSSVLDLGVQGGISCLITHGEEWIFVAIPGAVKVWNTHSNTEQTLTAGGDVGQIYSLAEAGKGLVCAGTRCGSILLWKYNDPSAQDLNPSASLTGHAAAVVSLAVSSQMIFSGSVDNTIKAWNLDTLDCIQTLQGHTQAIISLLCWDQYLLSSSLDKTVKVWMFSQESGKLQVAYTHEESDGVLNLSGIEDSQNKPILLCSCNDNVLRLYDLPSFQERGKIFSKEEIRAIQVVPGGLFFTGDATGDLKVWKLAGSFQH